MYNITRLDEESVVLTWNVDAIVSSSLLEVIGLFTFFLIVVANTTLFLKLSLLATPGALQNVYGNYHRALLLPLYFCFSILSFIKSTTNQSSRSNLCVYKSL